MKKSWLELEGKTVIVTGGASGIGKAVVQEFLDNGANVVVGDMSTDAPAFQKKDSSGEELYIKTDVANYDSVNEMVSKAKEKFGKIDILVNNAGINIPRLLVDAKEPQGKYELSEAIFDKIVNVNQKGVFFCTQAVARDMLKKGLGVIINMSSESGLEGSEGQSIYAATKNAVNSFTRSWAKELGKKGIRVVGVAPGILEATGLRTLEYETALSYTRGITVDNLREGYSKTSTTPLGRSGKLTEVADLVCYLASDRASYVHGVTYNVAGGKTRG
ncbi:SDR family oxidoreductase [Clostridium sp.]|uniref:SDR family oxidoreductase n=1 Tax=Clostridium sp. TaxID=1506 RepID=UPI002587074F|nr:SDR family oxidoreductase [Clostridium sp.]